ncbi:MAG: hypothetical protein M1824_002036 [Vezdaea acicularis]|nr:MAG: hypothetical protein M1824_002036 [Vezdaea acicularis]
MSLATTSAAAAAVGHQPWPLTGDEVHQYTHPTLPAKPARAATARGTASSSHRSSDEHYQIHKHHRVSTSQVSSPEAVDSPAGSSIASFSQPASPARSSVVVGRRASHTYPLASDDVEKLSDGSSEHSAAVPSQNHEREEEEEKQRRHRRRQQPDESSASIPSRPSEVLRSHEYISTSGAAVDDPDDYTSVLTPELGGKAPQILLFLTLTSPLLSLPFALYTLLIILLFLLTRPHHLFTKPSNPPTRPSFLLTHLAPLHRYSLRRLHCALPHTTAYSAPRLAMVLIAAPAIALPLMAAGWVVGAFWAFEKVVGDSGQTGRGAGREERAGDGVRAVIWVRGLGLGWLRKALR